jgi:hypothetical protein
MRQPPKGAGQRILPCEHGYKLAEAAFAAARLPYCRCSRATFAAATLARPA